jgi:hypothetical protein
MIEMFQKSVIQQVVWGTYFQFSFKIQLKGIFQFFSGVNPVLYLNSFDDQQLGTDGGACRLFAKNLKFTVKFSIWKTSLKFTVNF